MAMATSYMMYFRNRRLRARQEAQTKIEDDANNETLLPTDKPAAREPLNNDKLSITVQDTCQRRQTSNKKSARNDNS
ncbi:Hypothetical predicted protein [Paramuricea clavata]|uniref:Uncharacterized protein n=1 Tax=Paramuricea clavata TaxID=317549 RepID=A0A7D9ECR6_PARCT|nr:Hypothetical predicted protein [Paramuricea clavata]